jgi:hypothetical protein
VTTLNAGNPLHFNALLVLNSILSPAISAVKNASRDSGISISYFTKRRKRLKTMALSILDP